MSFAGPSSTSIPRYITPMVSQNQHETLRSWAMKRNESPLFFLKSCNRFRIWACTLTSRALTTSSQTRTSGSIMRPRAMEMRCLCPPENSDGFLSKSFASRPVSSRIAAAFARASSLSFHFEEYFSEEVRMS